MVSDQKDVLRPGLRLGEPIAGGSFGVVYRGRQLAVDREVAIKILHPEFAPETEPGQLFRDEIRAIGTIDHRNVVRVFDADDTSDGRIYFVMELLEGPTLEQLARRGRLPAARAIALVGQLLDGLAAVHAAGHIHADVKPSNAIVAGSGADERVVLIDFGLSRLRPVGRPAEAVGGTRAYMAPEQLRAWEVDARSDVFSAALILVRLVTGWEREHAADLIPPLEDIHDPALRLALERALAIDPAERPTATDFARALRGGEPDEAPPPGPPPPFRELAPLTERDRGRLHGREAEVIRLARRLDSGRAVVFTAPSGTGKTSLLRAGLVPYLDAAGTASVYVACEPGAAAALAHEISGGAASITAAITAWRAARDRRLVVILDQLEALLTGTGEGEQLLDELLGIATRSPDAGIAVVLGVREDFVARLLAATPELADGAPQVRLGPLDRDGARAALVEPLVEHGISLQPALLDQLLDDLVRAAAELGADLGWGTGPTIYPPHLQLVGTTLFDRLGSRETELTLEHYRQLGGFDAIVGEHLDRSLGELSSQDRAIARDLFLTLVASSQTRAIRTEAELLESVGARYGDDAVRRVLERLEAQRLLTRRNGPDGAASWSLVHDTLVPRIEAWVTIQDLDRRRATELLRFHLRQSQPDAPAFLGAQQLKVIDRYPGILDELEVEWDRRPSDVWRPRGLVARSRQAVRYQRSIIGVVAVSIAAVLVAVVVSLINERSMRRRDERLRDLDLGLIDLVLEPFDLQDDPDTGIPFTVPVAASILPKLDWALHDPDSSDGDDYNRVELAPPKLVRGHAERLVMFAEREIEVRGGNAFLVVNGRARAGERECHPAVIPLRDVPGHDKRKEKTEIRVKVPTCRAAQYGMKQIPAGEFVSGGGGDPKPSFPANALPRERQVNLGSFWIDRTEVTVAAYRVFASQSHVHGISEPHDDELWDVKLGPLDGRGSIDWFEARAYCRFFGKELQTRQQWQKVLRGGLQLDGAPNPFPTRNLPWDPPWLRDPVPAAISMEATEFGRRGATRRPSLVGTHPADKSVYEVVDLAGNLQEWTDDLYKADRSDWPTDSRSRTETEVRKLPRITRGGNWWDTPPESLVDYMVIDNPRVPALRYSFLGARCAMSEP